MSVCLQKEGLNLGGSGQWNLVTEIQPVIEGDALTIEVGSQRTPSGPVFWGGPQPFVPGADYKIDCLVDGMYHAVRFCSEDDVEWRLTSYKVIFEPTGER